MTNSLAANNSFASINYYISLDFQFDATADMITAQDAQVDALLDTQVSTADSQILELDSSTDGMLIEVMDFKPLDLSIQD